MVLSIGRDRGRGDCYDISHVHTLIHQLSDLPLPQANNHYLIHRALPPSTIENQHSPIPHLYPQRQYLNCTALPLRQSQIDIQHSSLLTHRFRYDTVLQHYFESTSYFPSGSWQAKLVERHGIGNVINSDKEFKEVYCREWFAFSP